MKENIKVGESERPEPCLYYLLICIEVRFYRFFDVVSQKPGQRKRRQK